MGRPESLTIPNAITVLRILLVPVFVACLFLGEHRWALICFAGAALSDYFDGLLARLLDQRSRLGAVLDPVADKLLVFSALTALVISGALPRWLLAGVVFRDTFLAGVAWSVRRRQMQVTVTPTRVGKYATFALSLLVVLALVSGVAPPAPTLRLYIRLLTLVAGLAVAISAVQYIVRFGRLLWSPPGPPEGEGAR